MMHFLLIAPGVKSNKLLILTIVLLQIISLTVARNQSVPDSLIHELSLSEPDTNKVLLLKRISIEYESTDLLEAIKFGMEGLDLAREIGFDRELANLCNNIGLIYFNQGIYDKAIEFYLESERIKK